MKRLILFLLLFLSFIELNAQVHVRGYYKSNGTYVQPHYRSNPDGKLHNNWSCPGNANPYTGKIATGNPNTYLNNYYTRDFYFTDKKVELNSSTYYLSNTVKVDNNPSSTVNKKEESPLLSDRVSEAEKRYRMENFRFSKGVRLALQAGTLVTTSPFEDAKLVGQAKAGTAVVLEDQIHKRVYVQQGNLIGYINPLWIERIEMFDSPESYRLKVTFIDSLSRRVMLNSPILLEPRAGATIIAKSKTKSLTVVGKYDDWYFYVKCDGIYGYLGKSWIME